MKKLTNKDKKKIIMQSLPVAILAAIAFITAPSVVPESYDGMAKSVTAIECRECYEITAGGKVVAVCNDIKNDTTLDLIKEKVDSDTERKVMVCGTWINKYPMLPSCHGRILTINPFYNEHDMLAVANANIENAIEKTIQKSEDMQTAADKKQKELEYYLNTHSVKDEGYNTMAAYTEENRKRAKSLEQGLAILKNLKGKKDLHLRKRNRYTLLYSEDEKRTCRIQCHSLAEESGKHGKGLIVLQTNDESMPKGSNSVHLINLTILTPDKGDSISVAGIFGLNARSTANIALQKANTFNGVATSKNTHDIPPLLAPNGAPLFNRHGYFIGINDNGRIAK